MSSAKTRYQDRGRIQLAFVAAVAALGVVVPLSPAAAADTAPYVVKNIRPGSASSNPRELAAFGNILLFVANDGSHGRELWRSDGTRAGTKLVKDIAPGTASSDPRDITAVGTKAFFSARDGLEGRELWVTDGTGAGTRRVKDIRPGSRGSAPLELTRVRTRLFFTANDAALGRELWKSDGTAAGTKLVKDINTGSASWGPLSAFEPGSGSLTSFGGRLFFAARQTFIGQYDIVESAELWVSDGTNAGTKPFHGWDPVEQEFESIRWPEELTKVGARLYLRSEEQLWRSDGTPMKTRSLGTADPYELTNAGGTLFFRGPEGLWKSNGTKAGTKLVAEASEPSQLTNVSGTLFFTTLQDGWQGMLLSDGTSAGTYGWRGWNTAYGSATNLTSIAGRLHYTYNGYLWYVIVCPQPECPESSGAWDLPVTPYDQPEKAAYGARNLTNVAGALYYSASEFDAAKGTELWRYVP